MKRLSLFCVLAIWGWTHSEAQTLKKSGDVMDQQSVIEYNHTLKDFTIGLITEFDPSLSYKKLGEIPCKSNPDIGNYSGGNKYNGIVQNVWGNKGLISFYDKAKSTDAGQKRTTASLGM